MQAKTLCRLCIIVVAALIIAGCGTRSISNSGYYADSDRGYGQRNSPFYKGELNEFDVLGIDPVGVTDSFLDLGGDSLRAAEVANRLQAWPGATIRFASLLEHATISALADSLHTADVERPEMRQTAPAGQRPR